MKLQSESLELSALSTYRECKLKCVSLHLPPFLNSGWIQPLRTWPGGRSGWWDSSITVPCDSVWSVQTTSGSVGVCLGKAEGKKKGTDEHRLPWILSMYFPVSLYVCSSLSSWQDCRNTQLPEHRLSTVMQLWIQTLKVWSTVCSPSTSPLSSTQVALQCSLVCTKSLTSV